ncbi:MAG: hypothetical protein H6662_17140 [Ardenticatenaceae bacterium]|nr:hypothetical protein [Anaerolineales bacterium]MCB8923316.1 hypothetical protein [Ardenticatenaceae bacterium]MCB9004685.1 hypothetical protein [Ardenticatenaceae bacterium]
MDYTRISKIEKSKVYAEERSDRIDFVSLTATVKGDNNGSHTVKYNDGVWTCDCAYNQSRHEVCTHIMALERILTNMVELAQ